MGRTGGCRKARGSQRMIMTRQGKFRAVARKSMYVSGGLLDVPALEWNIWTHLDVRECILSSLAFWQARTPRRCRGPLRRTQAAAQSTYLYECQCLD